MESNEKFCPAAGEKVSLYRAYTGTSVPCTVVGMRNPQVLIVRECRLTFPQPRYFDTYPDSIEEGRPGIEREHELRWSKASGCWKEKGVAGRHARFGIWVFEPNLN